MPKLGGGGYLRHAVFVQPRDQRAPVWRYMTLAKFIAMLASSDLWFSRADLLEDSFEGSMTRDALAREGDELGVDAQIREFRRNYRHWTFINCWTLGPAESAAMWRQYTGGEGVAIKSDFRSLTRALRSYPDAIYVGRVKYIDYEIGSIPSSNILYPFVHKRREFASEREIRAVVPHTPVGGPLEGRPGSNVVMWDSEAPVGIGVPVDLDVLIHEVRVSPGSRDWYVDLVQTALTKWSLDKPVHKTDLDKVPNY